MLKRLAFAAATIALAAACASQPVPVAAGPAPAPATGTVGPTTVTVLNIAATSSWQAEERLLPQDPILALVGASGALTDLAGFSMTCNPDNGKIVARLGRQPANRAGQTAMYRLRLGAEAKQVEGKFEAAPKTNDAEFVFGLSSADLRAMAGANMFSMITDGGEVQWAFVSDPGATVQAKYVASTKNLAAESAAYLVYCNPK
jgi:hypothetical protein